MAKGKQWRSSWQALRDAATFCKERSEMVGWLFLAQVLVVVLVVLLVASSGEQGLYATVYGIGGNIAIQSIASGLALLFSTIYIMSLTAMIKNPKERSLQTVLQKSVFPRLPGGVIIFTLLLISVTVGGALYILPGVILYLVWQFALQAYVFEDCSIKDAFLKSYWLVKGWWLAALDRITMLLLVFTGITFFRLIPGVGVLVAFLLSLLFSPILIAYIGKTYEELQMVKAQSPKEPFGFFKKVLILFWWLIVFILFATVSYASDIVAQVIFVGQ